MQSAYFLQRYTGRAVSSAELCPGVPVVEAAHVDLCTYRGVDVFFGGTSIVDLFDDNVQMKDVRFSLHGERHFFAWGDLMSHPFPVGSTKVWATGRDLAGNTRQCYRMVHIEDRQP